MVFPFFCDLSSVYQYPIPIAQHCIFRIPVPMLFSWPDSAFCGDKKSVVQKGRRIKKRKSG